MPVIPTKFLGICDDCQEPSPEERDSAEAAQKDIDECPCKEES